MGHALFRERHLRHSRSGSCASVQDKKCRTSGHYKQWVWLRAEHAGSHAPYFMIDMWLPFDIGDGWEL